MKKYFGINRTQIITGQDMTLLENTQILWYETLGPVVFILFYSPGGAWRLSQGVKIDEAKAYAELKLSVMLRECFSVVKKCEQIDLSASCWQDWFEVLPHRWRIIKQVRVNLVM